MKVFTHSQCGYDTIHTHTTVLRLSGLHLFNGLFPRTTWVSRHQKGKSFWF